MIISHSGTIGDDWDVFGPREAKQSIDYAMASYQFIIFLNLDCFSTLGYISSFWQTIRI
jgi:hypothetical protein